MDTVAGMLSIIMPIYNGEKFLTESIHSVLHSSYSNFELLLIDDGSNDSSQKIMKQFEEKDNRVKCICKENGGIVSARNMGLQHAIGEYISFIDQDDMVSEEMYKICIERMNRDHSDMCCSNYYKWFENGLDVARFCDSNTYIDDTKLLSEYLIGGSELIPKNYTPKARMSNSIWNCMYKNNIIRDYHLRFFSFVDFEDDWLFNIQFLKHIKRCSFVNQELYYWRTGQGGSESSRHKYITDFYKKRINLEKYLKEVLHDTKWNTDLFWTVFQKRTFLWGYYNDSLFLDFTTFNSNMNSLRNAEQNKGISDYIYKTCSIMEKFSLLLIMNGKFRLAYYLNRIIMKKHFH